MLDILSGDQAELSKVLTIFQRGVANHENIPESAREQWVTLESSVRGLAKTLKSFEDILNEVRGVRMGVGTRPVQLVKLDMKKGEIDTLKKRIEAFTRTIQLSVQYINLYGHVYCRLIMSGRQYVG